MVSDKFISDFLRTFTFFTGEFLLKISVKFIKKFARNEMKNMPMIQYLVQCLTGCNSIPSFKFLMNFSALSLSLYNFNIFSASALTELSRMKKPSIPVIYGFPDLQSFFVNMAQVPPILYRMVFSLSFSSSISYFLFLFSGVVEKFREFYISIPVGELGMGMKYWQRYDARYKLCNVKNLYYFIQSKARKLDKPFGKKGKKGRHPALSPYMNIQQHSSSPRSLI